MLFNKCCNILYYDNAFIRSIFEYKFEIKQKEKKNSNQSHKKCDWFEFFFLFFKFRMNLFCLINLIFKLLLFNKCCNALYYDNVIVSSF